MPNIKVFLFQPVYIFAFRTKYVVSEERVGYRVFMSLKIKEFSSKDVGTYNCVSTNSLGKAEGTLRLYGKHIFAFKYLKLFKKLFDLLLDFVELSE